MAINAGLLVLILCIGTYAAPTGEEDVSVFFKRGNGARIIGGTVAERVPYMVGLTSGLMFRSLVCGGSLITNRHVLTAAHCIDAVYSHGSLWNNFRGVVGTNNFYSGGTVIIFSHNITHQDYDVNEIKNDIGILVSGSNIALNDNVQLISLSYDWIAAGVPTTLTGWGRTQHPGHISYTLLQLDARTVDEDFCVKEVARIAELTEAKVPTVDPSLQVCALHSAGRGACLGDSGSPLVRSDTNEQIGVVSWGVPCAHGAPDMFARVSVYRDWIQQNIR